MELHDQMLLVPIKLKALVIGEGAETEFAGPTVNFGAFQGEGTQIQTEPFTRHKKPEPGVHLHWFLPESLIHGVKGEQDSEVIYKKLPDRWIVTRVEIRRATSPERKIVCRSFEVESNFISAQRGPYNEGSILVPTERGNKFLGRSGEYGRLPASKAYVKELTAAGYGEPGFYAYYPNCRNVFGFYDKMDGVDEQSHLFYHICGWYNRREQDPADGLSGEDLADAMRQLGFEFSRSVPKKSALFWNPEGDGAALLFHGTCYGLAWRGKSAVYESGIPKGMPKIAIGNTSLEAFAALVANQTKRIKRKSERILNAFLGNLMEEWADLDGVIKVEERIHQDTLQPADGGIQWDLKKKENIDEGSLSLRNRLKDRLELLNLRERSREKLRGYLQYLEKQAYFAWFRYKANKSPQIKELAAEQWRVLLDRIVELDHELKLETDSVDQQRKELLEEAKDFYELNQVPAERFWTPCEPVLLFSGEGMSQDYGNSGAEKNHSLLAVRTFAQIVTSFPVPEGEMQQRVEADYLWSYIFLPVQLPAPVKRLLGEALLLSPECAAITAYEAMLLSGKEATGHSYQEMQAKIGALLSEPWQTAKERAMEESRQEAEKLGYEGILPDKTGVTYYYAPWNPLYMEWGISYTPDPSHDLDNWELEEIDYRLKEVLPLAVSCRYRGRMVLTPHMMQSLADTITTYREKHPEKALGELLGLDEELEKELGKHEILSQRLSGFYTNFLTQRDVIRGHLRELWQQDPVIGRQMEDIFSLREVTQENQRRILDAIDAAAETEPYIGAIFSPMRMGSAQLKELRFIDSFGQVKKLAEEGGLERRAELYLSEQMDSDLYKNTMVLTPRLLQPARLSFEWVKGAGGVIFGWLVPNYIDSSLMVFDETGTLIGTFLEVEDQAGNGSVKCLSPSGHVISPEEVRANHRLSEFMRHFGKRMQEKKKEKFRSLRHFVDYLSDELSGMNLPGMAFQKNLMHFIGRPLALADAEICIETSFPLWKRQTWTGEEDSDSFSNNIKMALRLGDQRKRSDGLAGFFRKQRGGETDYSQFYAYGSNRDDQGYIRFDNRVPLPINDPVEHTLLFDPTQVIHLITGILPVRQVRIPDAAALAAQERLNMQMLTGPVLAGEKELRLPLAVLPGKRWSFFTEGEGEQFPIQAIPSAFAEEYPLKMLEGFMRLTKEEEEPQNDG